MHGGTYHLALVGVVEALQQLDAGALPTAAAAHERQGLAGPHRHAQPVQPLDVWSGGVREIAVDELQVAFEVILVEKREKRRKRRERKIKECFKTSSSASFSPGSPKCVLRAPKSRSNRIVGFLLGLCLTRALVLISPVTALLNTPTCLRPGCTR